MCFGSEADCMETKKILGIVLCISIVVLVGCVKSEDAMEVNWLEFDGVEYYLTDEEVDAGYYENDWVKVVLLGTSPVKYEIVLKTNTSRERCRVRIGINCFHYSYRILSIVQQSGE